MEWKNRIRVFLLSQAPGVGGGERTVIPVLAKRPELEVMVAGYEPVCQYAETFGLQSLKLELPWVDGLSKSHWILKGGKLVRDAAQKSRAGVLYANGTRAMTYGVGAKILGGPPFLAHHQGVLTTGPTGLFAWGIRKWADLIVVSSKASAEHFLGSEKLVVQPTGIDLQRFKPAVNKGHARSTFRISNESVVVGTVTRADPRKGMNEFLDVAERLIPRFPDVQFLLVGGATFPAEETEMEKVRTRAKNLGTRIALTGPVEDVLPAYQAMDIFLHLSQPEAFPTTVMEAMACGLPVIAFRWGGVSELVVDQVTGFLVEPKVEEAESASAQLVADQELRTRMGQAGLNVAEERFDSAVTGEKLAELIGSLSE